MAFDGSGPVVVGDIRTYLCDTGQGRSFLFVVVETEDGLIGVGEGSQNDQDAAVVANVDQLAPSYLGHDVFGLIERRGRLVRSSRAGRAMCVAVSALEQALWDLIGKSLGRPVFQLLGGAARAEVATYATMAAGLPDHTPETLADEAAKAIGAGHAGVKVVPFPELFRGQRPTSRLLALGCERVKAVRTAIGDDALVMIECQFAFDRPSALEVARLLAPFQPFWLEAPLAWDDPVELALLRSATPLRIASGETLHGRLSYRGILEAGAVDVLQPDVKWTGGILEARKVAAWAEACQVAIAPHNNSGPVATAASAHLALTLQNALVLEMPSRRPDWDDAITGATPSLTGGPVAEADLAGRPGLGVDFDEGVARQCAITPT